MNIFSGSILNYLSLLLFALIAAGLSFYLYNKADLPKFSKAALIALRTASLFLILFLLLNPFVEYIKHSTKKPPNIILADRSESMGITDGKNLTDKAIEKLKSINDVKIYSWGNGILREETGESADTTLLPRYSTNLSKALSDIKDLNLERINSITILSDGLINAGGNITAEANKLKAPVHYLLTGDTVQRKDVVLSNVLFNRKQFINSASKVFVKVDAFDFKGEIKVNLFENNVKIKSNPVIVSGEKTEYETVFEIASSAPGTNKYTLEIEPVENEITTINNKDIFYVRFIDNKIKLLVISGNPSYDLSALKQTLNRSENIEYETRVQKSSTEFYEGALPGFSGYDAILLHGIPNNTTSVQTVEYIKTEISKSGSSLIFLNSGDISTAKLSALNDLLPFGVNDASQKEARGKISIIDSRINENTESMRRLGSLPPSFFLQGAFTGKPNSTILGLFGGEPGIIYDNSGMVKSAAFLGYGFYEWNLSPGGSYDHLQSLISGFISLCVDENSKDKFTVKSDKDCYAVSEPVEISALLKSGDEAKEYSTKVTVSGSGKTVEAELSKYGENRFSGSMKFFDKGDYTVKADLYENGVFISSAVSKFSVDEAFGEYRKTRADAEILKQISANTGGKEIQPENTGEYGDTFKTNDELNEQFTFKILFRNSVWYLISVLILLSIEWYLRKRNNLA